MHYVIMKDNEKIERLRTKLGAEWRRYHPTGSIVSFSMPALDIPLPVLWPVAKDFKWGFRQQFLGAVYYIRTNNRYVSQIVPMAEHFVMGCVALAEQRYAMQLSITRIVGTATQLAELYRASRRVREATGQPHFRIGMHVYTVTADFAHFLFTARSLLDSLAALLPYLYGPNANRFGSFGDFVGKVCKESPREGDFQDDDVRIHLKEKGEWFGLLRDLRD